MSKTKGRLLSTLGIFVLACVSAFAQDGADNAYSPYTVFGIGDLYTQGNAINRSMGGVGIASRSRRSVNYINPASITERDTLSFMMDFGLTSNNKYYKQSGATSANNTMNVSNFVFTFPVYKSFTMMFGLTPFSDVGYNFSSIVTDTYIIGNIGNGEYATEGAGGLYQMFLGGAVELWNRFSVGAEAIYFFGNIGKASSLAFTDGTVRTISSGYDMDLHTFAGKVGVQYEQPLSRDLRLVLGATYRPEATMKGHIQDYSYALVSSVIDTLRNDVDTLTKSNSAKISAEVGVGVALKKGEKWSLEVNYTYSDWTTSHLETTTGFANIVDDSDNNIVFTTGAAHALRAGFEYTPNRNDVRYYYRRCTYRCGAYYERAYYKIDNQTIDAYGVTLGITFPVNKWYNGVTFGTDIGKRGNTNNNMTREFYLGFFFGVSLHDMWFMKQRYN